MIQIAAGLFYGLIYGIIVTYIVDKMVEPYKYVKFIKKTPEKTRYFNAEMNRYEILLNQ